MVDIFSDIEDLSGLSEDDLSLVINRGKYQMFSSSEPSYMIRVYQEEPASQIRRKFVIESHMLEVMSRCATVPSPSLITSHLTDDHLILIMEKLNGVSLHEVWDFLTISQRQQLAAQLGDILNHLHGITESGYGNPEDPVPHWHQYIMDRVRSGLAMIDAQLSAPLLTRVVQYLDRQTAVIPSKAPVIVHGDLNSHNILIDSYENDPVISGIVDWEWSIAADYKYDLTQIESLFYNSDIILNQFFQNYGTIPPRQNWVAERKVYLIDRFIQNACYYYNLDQFNTQRRHLTEFMLSSILKNT